METNLTQHAHSTKRLTVSWRPVLIILGSAIFLGVLAFSIALSRDAKLQVFGIVEVARAYSVDVNGSISSDFVIDPALIVRAVNAGRQQHAPSDDSASRSADKAHIVARLARGGNLVELEALSDSLSAAEKRINEIVNDIEKNVEPMRENALARLHAQNSESLEEMRRLGEWRDKLDPSHALRTKRNDELIDSLTMIVMGMMRADTERQLYDIQRQQRAYLTALNLMEERKTRLIVPVFVETALPLASIAAGLVGFFVGALAASAVLFVRRQPLVSIA